MNVPVVHYDIRAVAGVTRAACGIDNTIDEFDVFQSSNNRNYITCEDCRAKIDLLAEFGGAAIMAPQDHDNPRWFIDAVKEAVEEILRENPVQFVQNIVQPESLSASEVYRQTRGLLEHSSAHAPLPVNFAEFNHQALGVWAAANDLVREWSYDTNMVRRLSFDEKPNGRFTLNVLGGHNERHIELTPANMEELMDLIGVVYYGAIEESSEDYMVRLMKRAIAEDRAEETKRVQDWERLVQERAWRVLGISG